MDTKMEEIKAAQTLPITNRFINLKIYNGEVIKNFLTEQQRVLDGYATMQNSFLKQERPVKKHGKTKKCQEVKKLNKAVSKLKDFSNITKELMLFLDKECKCYKINADLIELEISKKKSSENNKTLCVSDFNSSRFYSGLICSEEIITGILKKLASPIEPDQKKYASKEHNIDSINDKMKKAVYKEDNLLLSYASEVHDAQKEVEGARTRSLASRTGVIDRLRHQVASENQLLCFGARPVLNIRETEDSDNIFSGFGMLPDPR